MVLLTLSAPPSEAKPLGLRREMHAWEQTGPGSAFAQSVLDLLLNASMCFRFPFFSLASLTRSCCKTSVWIHHLSDKALERHGPSSCGFGERFLQYLIFFFFLPLQHYSVSLTKEMTFISSLKDIDIDVCMCVFLVTKRVPQL